MSADETGYGDTQRPTAARLLLTFLYILVFPALILFLAGDWLWPEGWILGAWFVALSATIIVYLYRKDPALLAERYRKPGTGGQKGWDRYLVAVLGIAFALWISVMPLDARRYGWSPDFPFGAKIIGGAGMLLSSFLSFRAHADNTFLSPWVRIQTERGQRVVSTGVYSLVRHPLYLGAILMFFSAPLLLGSLYGILGGVLLSVIIAARSVGEERMLVEELPGYAAYRKKVKYRLIPFFW